MTVRNLHDPLEVKRHSFAHLVAAAVTRLFPGTHLGVGPVIDNGFYHDFELPEGKKLSEADLPRIEAMVRRLITEAQEFAKKIVPIQEAIQLLQQRGQVYTQELAEDLEKEGIHEVSFYSNGEFSNMCTGPHIQNTRLLDSHAFKLMNVAGVYWKGDEQRPQIQRIYGAAFHTSQALEDYLKLHEEAKRRDHRKLGKELDLFVFSPLVGAGLPLFTSKGALIRKLISDFILELQKPFGYQQVWIPHLTKTALYKTSGHWDKYKNDLFYVRGKHDNEYVLKPMNCPHHTQIYASRLRSFRELPLRFAEVSTTYRDEQPGELQGLSRVLAITVDDAHLFCTPEQVLSEVLNIFKIIEPFYAAFHLPLTIRLSLRDPEHPENYLGSEHVWEQSESLLAQAIESFGKTYLKVPGEAAFYGPKIDFLAKDSLGRSWQVATIQIDFNQPERFQLVYQDHDGKPKAPVMIHRAIAGSLERFMAILIEHFAGAFPLWLAPLQLALLPVAERHVAFAQKLAADFREYYFRVEVFDTSTTVSKKIVEAAKLHIPYVLVLGDKEIEERMLSIRKRGNKKVTSTSKDEFIALVQSALKSRTLEL